MVEQEVFLDVARRLDRIDLSYMLTGSLASMYYGIPRFTHDIDLVIQIPPTAVEKLRQTFDPEYFVDAQMIRDAYKGTQQFNLLHHESGLKIDFWMVRADEFHRSMFERRKCEDLWNQKIWICTPEDVILHKLYWNNLTPSDRQLSDIRGVIQVKGKDLDWDYITKWAKEMSLTESLQKVRS